jgi:Domain of unknown function (DUF4864)
MLGIRPILSALAVFLALCAGRALADDAPPPEVRALIERQFEAFAHDDAAGAYDLAAPEIKALFPDSEAFMAMVRKSYAPVYRHRGVEFGAFAYGDDKIHQTLTIVDNDNQVWTAIYILEKQPEGNWRISGCVLTKSTDTSL